MSTCSQANEAIDPFCNPACPRQILIEEMQQAAVTLKPHIMMTPCKPSNMNPDLNLKVYYKLETLHSSGSCKERGILNAILELSDTQRKLGIVIASIGNGAVAASVLGAKMGVPVMIVVPCATPLYRLQKCEELGAKIVVCGATQEDAENRARFVARQKRLTYINCRDHPHVLMGYGSIALEILEQMPPVDAVLVPVGSGGLLAAIATVIKARKPKCLVYGIQAASMTAFTNSLESGEIVCVPTETTIAEDIAVNTIGVNAFINAQPLVDRMIIVDDNWIARSMLHMAEQERLVVEGAAACPLAAIISEQVKELKSKNVVCVVSGGNVDPTYYSRSLTRGLAAEGRLVQFTVKIKDDNIEQKHLLNLLARGGYNLVSLADIHRWMEDNIYKMETQLVVRTKDMAHSLELKRAIQLRYRESQFENEPFNDKKVCPCYARKSTLTTE